MDIDSEIIMEEKFKRLIKEKFGDVEISQELEYLLYEFYLSGAKDFIEKIGNRILNV